MSSAISGFVAQIMNAVYGEQVRSAIVSAIEQCYSDVNNPSLQTEAFSDAVEEAYADGFLDIQEKTTIAGMTNEKIIYRYTGNQAGYIHNALYYYNGSAWVPIGSGIQTVATAALMTNQDTIYKYTGTESGYIQNALYYYNGTAFVPVSPATDKTLSEQNKPADAKATGDAIADVKSESEKQHPFATEWIIANLSNGQVLYNYLLSIVSKEAMTASEDIHVTVKPNYRFKVAYYTSSGTFSADTGWITPNAYTIPKGSLFRVAIAPFINRTVEDTEVEELANSVLVKSGWYNYFDGIKYDLISLFKDSAYSSSDVATTFQSFVGRLSGASSLPTGYTQYDYIEKTSNASSGEDGFLNIGFPEQSINLKNAEITIECEPLSTLSYDYACPVAFGIQGQYSNAQFVGIYFPKNPTTNIGLHYLFKDLGGQNLVNVLGKHKYSFKDGNFYFDDELKKNSNGTGVYSAIPIYLFCRAMSNAAYTAATRTYPFLGKIYSFKIFVGGAYLVNLVPCTNADGEKGMFDLARGQFFSAYNQDLFSMGNDE